MIEGFWILRIQPPPVTSGGVIMFHKGKIYGGDNAFAWLGTYSVTASLLKARVRVSNFDPEVKSLFGRDDDYEMHFSGNLLGDIITGTVAIVNQPHHNLSIRMEKYAHV